MNLRYVKKNNLFLLVEQQNQIPPYYEQVNNLGVIKDINDYKKYFEDSKLADIEISGARFTNFLNNFKKNPDMADYLDSYPVNNTDIIANTTANEDLRTLLLVIQKIQPNKVDELKNDDLYVQAVDEPMKKVIQKLEELENKRFFQGSAIKKYDKEISDNNNYLLNSINAIITTISKVYNKLSGQQQTQQQQQQQQQQATDEANKKNLGFSIDKFNEFVEQVFEQSKERGLLKNMSQRDFNLITQKINNDTAPLREDTFKNKDGNAKIAEINTIIDTHITNAHSTNNKIAIASSIILKNIMKLYLENIENENNTKNATLGLNEKITTDLQPILGKLEAVRQDLNFFKKIQAFNITESKIIKEYRDEINNLLIPTMQKELNFDRLPSIIFAEDEDNAKDMFGRTAHYNPNTSEITVFVSGRHPKDIMRSVAHEVVHHAQNCRGEFDNAFNVGEEGYAQSDNHLRNMEKEAYLLGNMLFRDWEDNLKKQRNSNTMINEKALRAKIRELINEEMSGAFDEPNQPIEEERHFKGDGCAETDPSHIKALRLKGINPQGFGSSEGVGYTTTMEESRKKILNAERDAMPLNEWRTKELNSLLMTRFGIVAPHAVLGEQSSKEQKQKEHEKYFGKEVPEKKKPSEKDPYENLPAKRGDKKGSKPDFLDLDGDGNKTEPMKQAAKQVKGGKKETEDKSKKSKGKVPPQLQKYVKGKK